MITYISGGERSGKSSMAQQMALELSDSPVYLATAKIWDDNFQQRIQRHQDDRDDRWTNIEEEITLSSALPPNRVVVIDCVTLWLTNIFAHHSSDLAKAKQMAMDEFDLLKSYTGQLIIVSNEIGMGLHAHSQIGRDFVELQGWVNQRIANKADEAYFMVSGLPIQLK